jgi:HAD superfamily hydrolase (TIGR01490 family)
MQKYAFFDFCGTLVSFQTADAFVDFVRLHKGNAFMKSIEGLIKIMYKLKFILLINKLFPKSSLMKKIKLLQLRGTSYKTLDHLAREYYTHKIRPNLIKPVLAEMQELKKQQYNICLVSAGYSIYIKYFALEYEINDLISTEIAFNEKNNICLGKILNKDCIRDEKVKRIKSYYSQRINLNGSVSYSDSITDLPLLEFTTRGVVISNIRSQNWSIKFKFREIIWN